jgi:hypothetical protein
VKPNLIVRDDVDRAARAVAGERMQVERFRDDALAGECGVAVDQDRHRRVRIEVPLVGGGRRAGHAFQHRIDRFEMARVRRHAELDLPASRRDHVARADVILHVSAVLGVFFLVAATSRFRELREDLVIRLAEHVRQHVQSAAMCHANEDPPHAGFASLSYDLIEDGDEHVQSFDRESCLAGERALQKRLERLDVGQAIENRARLIQSEEALRFDGFPQPATLLRHEDVGEVVADSGAVDLAQAVGQVGQRLAGTCCRTRHERRRQRLEVGAADAVRGQFERRIAHGRRAERVGVGRQMPIPPERLNVVEGPNDG